MKSRLLLLLMSLCWFIGVSAQSLQTDENGAYLIGSKEDLQALTEMEGYEAFDVVLTADIDDVDFMLCTAGPSYTGVFDGAGHTITVNLQGTETSNALFYNFAGTVKNLKIAGTITAAVKNTASFVFTVWKAGSRLENCISVAEIISTADGKGSGGFIGYDKYGAIMENCVFAGKIIGEEAEAMAGFVGWSSTAATTFKNCLMIGDLTQTLTHDQFLYPHGRATFDNSYAYDLEGATTYPNVTSVDEDMVTSGELTFLLNGDQSHITWWQTLGTDPFPTPLTGSKQVYGVGEVRCDGTPLGGTLTYSNEDTTPKPPHTDVDGFCSVCGSLMMDHLTPNADGFYELGTAKDVEWFAAMVNEAHQLDINGLLTADIDYENVENAHTPIGLNATYKYMGIFDGGGHRVKNMILNYPNNMVGFFGAVRGGATIKNLIVDESCSISGAGQVGGIIGMVQTATDLPLVVENCVNEAEVIGTGAAAGIIGAGASAYPVIDVRNCINKGDITGSPATSICSWINKGGSRITNCVNTGVITGVDNAGGKYTYLCNMVRYEPNSLVMTDCYDFSDMADMGQGIPEGFITDDPLESGELCYKYNGKQTEITWYQRIGTDATPLPLPIAGGQVYANGNINCDGTPLDDAVTYSNTMSSDIPAHVFVDGFCVNCTTAQDDFAPIQDGFFQLSTPAQLYWFSRQVSEYRHLDWNAQLTTDLDLTDYAEMIVPIGTINNDYRGHFDGQGHTLSNLYINSETKFTGLFGTLGNGAIIENLLLDETCSISGVDCTALVGGTNRMNGTVTLRNLGNMGNVFGTGIQAAGIFGGNDGSSTKLIIENCFSTGTIEGTDQCGALVGWAGGVAGQEISNCWSCADVTGNDKPEMYLVRITNNTLNNCYCTDGTQTPIITTEEITNGTLCFKLNGDQSKISWYQNLDAEGLRVDAQPVPFMNGHSQVFPIGKIYCDGSVDETSVTYSNNNEAVVPPHTFEEGFCQVCGQEDLDYTGFLKVIQNPDFSNGNASWSGTALSVNSGVATQAGKNFDSYQRITGLEKGVYRLRIQGYTSEGSIEDEEIYSDGELMDDALRTSYFYVMSDSLLFARRFNDISVGAQRRRLNDGVGEYELSNGNYVPTTPAAAANYFAKGFYWNKPLYFAVTTDTISIGILNEFAESSEITLTDRWRLEYVGNDDAAYALIAQQTVDEEQNLSDIEAQEPLKTEYDDLINQVTSLTDVDQMLQSVSRANQLPNLVLHSAAAYAKFAAAIEALRQTVAEVGASFKGEAFDALSFYLNDEEEASDEYKNGTAVYITLNREIDASLLEDELLFAQNLYRSAVKENIDTGADITALVMNPKFDDATDWNGWSQDFVEGKGSWNFHSNIGFTDVYPVAAGYNTKFKISQTIEGLPNGVYELRSRGYYRPGGDGEGLFDGTDILPANFFINDYKNPIKSVYSDILSYADAVNGQNCRIDPSGDPEAPHNGEETGSKDVEVLNEYGEPGVVPSNSFTASFAFAGGRYQHSTYAIVQDGTITLGVENTGNPWKNMNLVMFGGFELYYQGTSTEVMDKAIDQYEERIMFLDDQRSYQDHFFSAFHTEGIISKITQAREATDATAKMNLISQINDEFNAITTSIDLYKQLADINQYCMDMSDAMPDGEERQEMVDLTDEISIHLLEGDLTDDEAQAKIDELMDNPKIGGVIYVQGDLFDAESENMEWNYHLMCNLYPLYKNSDGKWVGSFKMQDRSRRINGYQRAGVYFRRINTNYKCATPNRNFITPARHEFQLSDEASGVADFQSLNGTFDVELDLENMTVNFIQKDTINWDNQVFITGTLTDRNHSTKRWANTEEVPLQHMGNGVYTGVVDLIYDNANDFCSFGIMANRSTNDMVNNSTVKRASWSEARYGSETEYLNITSGELVTDLVRGMDRTWRISPAGKYLIEFDMNHSTMKATLLQTKGNGTSTNPYKLENVYDVLSMQDRLLKGQTTYFQLMKDIDMAGKGWYPLNNTFFGNSYTEGTDRFVSLDGNNHVIKNLYVCANDSNRYATGFFGTLAGEVKNLGLLHANVFNTNAVSAGLLAGELGSESYVKNEDVLTTRVNDSYFVGCVDNMQNAGGMAGTQKSSVAVNNVYAYANILTTANDTRAGGLIGQAEGGLTLTNAYAVGEVTGARADGILGEQFNAGDNMLSNLVLWNSSITSDTNNTLGTASNPANNVSIFQGTQLNGSAIGNQSQSALCTLVSGWEGWAEDGTLGNGYPVLQWMAARGDAPLICGLGDDDPSAIEGIETEQTSLRGFHADDVVGVYDLTGRLIFQGRVADIKVAQAGIYLIRGKGQSLKTMLK